MLLEVKLSLGPGRSGSVRQQPERYKACAEWDATSSVDFLGLRHCY